MINFEQIIEGWKNHLFPSSYMKEIIKKVSEERMAICEQCEFHSKFHKTYRPDEHCIDCGCTLLAKTKCLSCECPLDEPKWEAVVTEEEEELINNESNGEEKG